MTIVTIKNFKNVTIIKIKKLYEKTNFRKVIKFAKTYYESKNRTYKKIRRILSSDLYRSHN